MKTLPESTLAALHNEAMRLVQEAILLNVKAFEMEEEKISEEMWCYHCEHLWETEDYFNCNSCPNCEKKPARIMRTSSTAYAYAWVNKQREKSGDPHWSPFKKSGDGTK